MLTSIGVAKADDQAATRTDRDTSTLILTNPRLRDDSSRTVDKLTLARTAHDSANKAERTIITDAGNDDPNQIAGTRGSGVVRVNFLINGASNALAPHSVVARATEKGIVKGFVIVLAATPHA